MTCQEHPKYRMNLDGKNDEKMTFANSGPPAVEHYKNDGPICF
jgi:hypothetical protein